jgi:N-sulfoglucosamine sulfohydrolase
VPFLVRWPGVSKAGLVSKAMVSTLDIAPTFYDAAGVQAPSPMHGQSLRGPVSSSGAKWREYLTAEFHTHGARPRFPRRAIRDTRYQLIHNLVAGQGKPSPVIDGDQAYFHSENAPTKDVFATFANPPEFELYDLQNDPDEFRNLAGKPEVAKVEQRLKAALLDWRKQSQDPFLDPEFLKKFMA